MNQTKLKLIFFLMLGVGLLQAQESEEDFIEFNDRRNVVHGVYIGLTGSYGKVDGYDSGLATFKIAYVANRQLEIGFVGTGFYTDRNLPNLFSDSDGDLIGGYGGIHLEPIFFGQKKINLSIPIMLGSGAIGYIKDIEDHPDYDNEDIEKWDVAFVFEPGVNLLYNISRYAQIEMGVKYRFSSDINLEPQSIKNLNGFSAGFGLKLGVFNLGRNRYKKKISND